LGQFLEPLVATFEAGDEAELHWISPHVDDDWNLAPAAFDRYVLALNIAGVLKALAKCAAPGDVRKAVRRYVAEKSDHRLSRLLRSRRQRPRHQGA
jgi:hypothetical protein